MKKSLSVAIVALAASVAHAQFQGTSPAMGNFPDNAPGISATINVPNAFPITGIAITLNNIYHTWVGDLVVTVTAPNSATAFIMRRSGASTTTGFGNSRDLGTTPAPTGRNYRFTDRFGAQNFSLLGGGATDISLAAAGTPSGNWWSAGGSTGGIFTPTPAALQIAAGDYIASGNNFTGTVSSSYVEVNLLALLGSQSNGDWTLTIRDHAGGDTGRLDSWTLQLLPEPASLALLGLGGLALIRRRRS